MPRFRSRPPVMAVALSAVLLLAALAAPAFGGPSVLATAKKALKLARTADSHAKRAATAAASASAAAKSAATAAAAAQAGAAKADADALTSSVGSGRIAAGAVTGDKLAAGAVTGATVQDGSLSLRDLAAADGSGTIDLNAVAHHTCESLDVHVPGAQPGQVPLVAFNGGAALPAELIVSPISVTATDSVRLKVCNPTDADSAAVTGVGVRIVTLG
jgi:hypothetical protein